VWLVGRDADVPILARDARISVTGYRYLHEGIDMIAANAPELRDVLAQGLREGWASRAWTAP
jgi:hypothetical protein